MSASSSPSQQLHLETLVAGLAKRLGGVWSPGGAMCRCPAHDDASPSLSIRVGDKALLFKCFAGCETVDVLRAIRRLELRALETVEPPAGAGKADKDEWLLARVQALWDQAVPVSGTPAERYLLNRAIDRTCTALRYHPLTPLGPRRAVHFRPAMLTAVRDGNDLLAVQRTFLEPERARRARDLINPRRMLGRPARGAFMLAPATDTLGLAEGTESALSAMILLGIAVWATLGNERLPRIAIPNRVTRLILLPDNDRGGRIGTAKAEAAYAMPGRTIETVWPPAGFNDWNDCLRAGGKGVGDWRRLVA
jgi:putative DNA primase/helicase